MEHTALLRQIPKIDDLLRALDTKCSKYPAKLLTELAREVTEELRDSIRLGKTQQIPAMAELCQQICLRAETSSLPNLREIVNATGITIHTNLGRSCLSEEAAKAVYQISRRYSTLEYDIENGARGSRHSHVQSILCRLTGAEDAMVVNNNAAAVLLILSALGSGGQVVVSRGELVEIGGSFRIPEIMEQCGCKLHEVGATNKTHLRDYERAIDENTRALLKVHTSNYRIMGFCESVPLAQLVTLAHNNSLPVLEDLGSGCLVSLTDLGIHDEPTVQESIQAGVDIVSFSGDKLLGGAQAGIIVGRSTYIELLKKHPLARAVRVDKMTLAALEATLNTYLDPERAKREIPTLHSLFRSQEEMSLLANSLCCALVEIGVAAEVIQTEVQVGGGSVPCHMLPSYAVSVVPKSCSVDALEEHLRLRERPIIGRINHDRYLLEVRTLWDEDIPDIVRAVTEALI